MTKNEPHEVDIELIQHLRGITDTQDLLNNLDATSGPIDAQRADMTSKHIDVKGR